jgi:hypothetical protein
MAGCPLIPCRRRRANEHLSGWKRVLTDKPVLQGQIEYDIPIPTPTAITTGNIKVNPMSMP